MHNIRMKLLFATSNLIALSNLQAMELSNASARPVSLTHIFEQQLSLCEAFITQNLGFKSSYVEYLHYQDPTITYAASAKEVLKDLKQASKLASRYSRTDSMSTLVRISVGIIDNVVTTYKKPVKEAVAQLPALIKLLSFNEKYKWISVMLEAKSGEEFSKKLVADGDEDFFLSRFNLIQALKQSDSVLIAQRINELKLPEISEEAKAIGLETNQILENFVLALQERKKKEKVSGASRQNHPDCAVS